MDKPTWQEECHRAAALFDGGDAAGAEKIYVKICGDEDPTLDNVSKSMMLLNLAKVRETLKNHDGVMEAFREAGKLSLQQYLYIRQTEAVFLVNAGRYAEGAALFEELLKSDALNADGRDACTSNLAIARQYLSGKAPTAPGTGPAGPSAQPGQARFTEAPRQTL